MAKKIKHFLQSDHIRPINYDTSKNSGNTTKRLGAGYWSITSIIWLCFIN